jgi:hypothetical protein
MWLPMSCAHQHFLFSLPNDPKQNDDNPERRKILQTGLRGGEEAEKILTSEDDDDNPRHLTKKRRNGKKKEVRQRTDRIPWGNQDQEEESRDSVVAEAPALTLLKSANIRKNIKVGKVGKSGKST